MPDGEKDIKTEPRVLTLDEVKCIGHGEEIWLEYGGDHNKLFMLTVSRRRRWGFTFYQHMPVKWINYGGPSQYTPEITSYWRVWTDRPTDTQRKEMKWDDQPRSN